jgi:ribosomal protein S18 acetylase RimI-like enzyme
MKFSFRSNTLPGIVAGRPHTLSASRVSSAVIAYVAVVPSHRGRSLARHLVHRGTEQLLESGAMKIRGDCDRDNVAMVKAGTGASALIASLQPPQARMTSPRAHAD